MLLKRFFGFVLSHNVNYYAVRTITALTRIVSSFSRCVCVCVCRRGWISASRGVCMAGVYVCVGSACDSRRRGRRRVVTRCARDAPAFRRRDTPRAGTPRRRYTRGKTRRPKLRGSVPAARIHYAHTTHTCRAKRPNIAPVAARHAVLFVVVFRFCFSFPA